MNRKFLGRLNWIKLNLDLCVVHCRIWVGSLGRSNRIGSYILICFLISGLGGFYLLRLTIIQSSTSESEFIKHFASRSINIYCLHVFLMIFRSLLLSLLFLIFFTQKAAQQHANRRARTTIPTATQVAELKLRKPIGSLGISKPSSDGGGPTTALLSSNPASVHPWLI